MISLKKESVVGEITPVHLMSEEEADERFRLSRTNPDDSGADGKSVTQNKTAEHFAADSGKAHSKKRKHDRGNRENNANTHRSLFSKAAQSIWKWVKREDVVAVSIIAIVLFALAFIFGASFISDALTPIEPTSENLEVSTYERSGIYKFTISDEIKVKGSEKVYNVSIAYIGTVSLTESEYMKYLGDEANALPVEVYEIEAEVPGAGQKFFQGKRYVFPWSENILPFSEDERKHFVELICKDSENKSIFLKELSLDYYSSGTHS